MSERSRSPSPPEVSDDEEQISYFDFFIEIGKQKNRESLERHRDILQQMRLRSEERVASMLKDLDAFYKKSLETAKLKVQPACRLASSLAALVPPEEPACPQDEGAPEQPQEPPQKRLRVEAVPGV